MRGYSRYVFDIPHCHGVSDGAMACMLSHWVRVTSDRREWLSDEALLQLKIKYELGIRQIERMSESVLSALDGAGLYGLILANSGELNEVSCQVNKDMAYLELEWV